MLYADLVLWILEVLLYLYVLLLIALRKKLRRYLSLSIYLGVVASTGVINMAVLHDYGITSSQYSYSYFFTESILSIFLYFAIAGHFQKSTLSQHRRRQLRIGSIVVAAGIAFFSYWSVLFSPFHSFIHMVFVLGQNLTWVCLFLAFVLCYSSLWNDDASGKARQISFVFAGQLAILLGIYVISSTVRVRNEDLPLSEFLSLWLPFGLAYVFSAIPSDTNQYRART